MRAALLSLVLLAGAAPAAVGKAHTYKPNCHHKGAPSCAGMCRSVTTKQSQHKGCLEGCHIGSLVSHDMPPDCNKCSASSHQTTAMAKYISTCTTYCNQRAAETKAQCKVSTPAIPTATPRPPPTAATSRRTNAAAAAPSAPKVHNAAAAPSEPKAHTSSHTESSLPPTHPVEMIRQEAAAQQEAHHAIEHLSAAERMHQLHPKGHQAPSGHQAGL
jgi:hypothetical protein